MRHSSPCSPQRRCRRRPVGRSKSARLLAGPGLWSQERHRTGQMLAEFVEMFGHIWEGFSAISASMFELNVVCNIFRDLQNDLPKCPRCCLRLGVFCQMSVVFFGASLMSIRKCLLNFYKGRLLFRRNSVKILLLLMCSSAYVFGLRKQRRLRRRVAVHPVSRLTPSTC